MAALLPVETGIALLGWLITLGVTRTVGPASCAAALLLPIAFFCCSSHTAPENVCYGTVTVVLALIIIYRHKDNLKDFFKKMMVSPGDDTLKR
jgi:glycerol-3-phosphate acyltransferase PlsY